MHPRIVSNAMELLEVEIPKMNGDIQFVHLSFMSDPFMYDAINNRNISQIQDLTMKIIRRLNEDEIKVTVLTKGLLPKELENDDLNKNNEYGITLVSTNDDFHSRFEPFSAPFRTRIDELENRHNAGLRTWVSLEPYPTPNLVEQDLNDLLSEVSFVDKIVFGKWNYYREVNGYSEKESFYSKCVDDVIDFCKTNDIQFHIKNGTPGSNSDTESLFS
jgi:DNA repair photolyase